MRVLLFYPFCGVEYKRGLADSVTHRNVFQVSVISQKGLTSGCVL